MFATIDLTTPLADGVTLAVGVRNSIDKSLPLGFCAGSRVFVCDNLSFRSELMVHRKHTRFGQSRFEEEIAQAVQSLEQFRAAEVARIARMQETAITDETAESLMLRAYERRIVSHRLLPQVIREWRQPRFEEFRPRTLWAIYNAFTSALAPRQKTNPQHFAALTIRLGGLLGRRWRLPLPSFGACHAAERKLTDGRFRPGPDPRRHVFTTEERQRGYQAAMSSPDPWVVAWVFRRSSITLPEP